MEQIDTVLEFLYNRKDDASPILMETIRTDATLLQVAGSTHELDRIIGKLISDKYVHSYPGYPKFPNGTNDMSAGLLNYCPITFDGRLFWESGGYEKNVKKKKREDFPKTYWWAIAAFTFIVGLFADVIKELLKQKILPNTTQQVLTLPKAVDSPQSRKILYDTSQSHLNDSVKAFVDTTKSITK